MFHRIYLSMLLALCCCGISAAQTLDFQDRECSGGGLVEQGRVIQEDGFTINQAEREPYQYIVWCVDARAYPCSTALFALTIDGLMKVTKDDGGVFSAKQIEAVALNGANVVPLSFKGIKSNGDEVFHKIQTDGRGPWDCMETFVFPNTFKDLLSLEWTQAAPYHQFDNLVLGSGADTCNYTIKKSKGKKGCKACPKRGADYGTEDECGSVEECRKKIKFKMACPDGGDGFCKTKAKRSSCG